VIIGIDIGGTKVATVLGTANGEILGKTQFATRPERGFSPVFEDIVASVLNARKGTDRAIEAISVSVGGPLDINGVINSPPNLPGWDAIPLKQLLGERTGLPVYIEHDGNAGALAEFFFGAGKGFRNIVFLTMGTGLGAGVILDGKLYRGTSNVAGEIGHIRIAEHGPACYGKAGSLEGYGSGTGIAKLAQIMFPSQWTDRSTALDVYAQYTAGSADAMAVFDRAAVYLGRGLAMIADMLNPERIILGGIGMRMADALVEPAKRVFREEVLPEAGKVCEIVPAQLGESIGDIASLCAAIDQLHINQ
jgi:glucokinase